MQCKYLLLALSILLRPSHAARILSVFAVPITSHYAFIEPLLKELAKRGHEVTSITNYPQTTKLKNFRDVVVEKNKHLFDDFLNFSMENIDGSYYETVDAIYNCGFRMCINLLSDPLVRRIIENENFDLIIADIFFSESFFGFAEFLRAPIVGVAYFGAYISIDELVGNISPLSYIPEYIFPFKEINFWQRLLNVLVHFVEWAHYYYKYMPVQEQIYEFYFPNATLTFAEAQKNFSLVLLNDHFALSQARPYVPNMIEVAGLHIVTNPEPIAAGVRHLMDSARAGVILVSPNLVLDSDMAKVFIRQFEKMPQFIVWITSKQMDYIPSNVYINGSLSLPSVITHPNIKLYIAPNSIISVVDSVYHGLAILGVSSTAKEYDYVDYVRKVGNGFSIKVNSISGNVLSKTLKELLSTPHYVNLAKTLSFRFRDQQSSPLERAIYWIEYVLRHNGAPHLKNRGQSLTWWQFYNVDVFVVIASVFTLVIILALVILKLLIKFFGNNNLRTNDAMGKKHN